MPLLFGIAIFVSAALLFMVQPMSGKVLLPLLGGSPQVWNTCMVFFQGVLLLGYLYSHVISKHVKPRLQPLVHLVVLAVASVTLPSPVDVGTPDEAPIAWLLRTMLLTVGPAFFAVSTTGPLLQRWFSLTDHRDAKDPYFLYAASNAGSFIGLLAYPFIVEPIATRLQQSRAWAFGFWALVPLVFACGMLMVRRMAPSQEERISATPSPARLSWRERGLWVLLAMVPSSLMVGVTQHIATDIAGIPLLWVIPLSAYLLTFVVAFSKTRHPSAAFWGRRLPYAIIPVMMVLLTSATTPVVLIMLIHVAVFTVIAMMCHTRLAEKRPDPSHLTEYFLWISVGGALGGAFNALASPLLFSEILEYPLMIGVACFLRPQVATEAAARPPAKRWAAWGVALVAGVVLLALLLNTDAAIAARKEQDQILIHVVRAGIPTALCTLLLLRAGSLRFAFGALALLCGSRWLDTTGMILRERTFFGVHQVLKDSQDHWHTLTHGTTIHGVQAREFPMRAAPTSYYHPSGPLGDVMRVLKATNRLDQLAFIGLGAGATAAYAEPGCTLDYYEIDPEVIRIATNPEYFTYLSDAHQDPDVNIRFFVGDGRLQIARATPGSYSVIVVDAFSSDAIPVHLLTREAIDVYTKALKPNGILAFHISSRYFDLQPVLARAAEDRSLVAYYRHDTIVTKDQKAEGKSESLWAVLAHADADLGAIAKPGSMWLRCAHDPRFPLWTDDYSNVLRVFVGWGDFKLPGSKD